MLDKFGVPRERPNCRLMTRADLYAYKRAENTLAYRDYKWLYNQYVTERKCLRQIERENGIVRKIIRDWLLRFGIKIRSNGEALHLIMGNHCNLSKEAREFIDGELLGDMSMRSNRKWSARIKYSSKYLEYIEWLAKTLKSFGIEQSGKIGLDRFRGKIYYHYESRQYEELLPLYQKWYPEGKGGKIVPEDLVLTPLICRQWYIGDGHLGEGRHIDLCSMGFSKSDVERLKKQLYALGFKVTIDSQNNIRISTYSGQSFLDYIGKCPIGCYGYKW